MNLKVFFEGIRHIFWRGYFSSPPLSLVASILFLILLFEILKRSILRETPVIFEIFLVCYISLVVLFVLDFLLVHAIAYQFNNKMNYFIYTHISKKSQNEEFYIKDNFCGGFIGGRDFFALLNFSLYQGIIIMKRPLWLIKRLIGIRKIGRENIKEGFENFYYWKKTYDSKKKTAVFDLEVFKIDKE